MPTPIPIPSIKEPERLVGGVAVAEGVAVGTANTDAAKEVVLRTTGADTMKNEAASSLVEADGSAELDKNVKPGGVELVSKLAEFDKSVDPSAFRLPSKIVEMDDVVLLVVATVSALDPLGMG
ncbi:hypothetical protein MMC30_002624 [Trapelia coarctata]|nr:hypothetical protein [Trapelia coarctata]